MRHTATGFTLIEIMVALVISGLLIAGSLQLYGVARSGYQSNENLAQLEERAAFALNTLADDIRLAGFWGRHSDGSWLAVPGNLAIHCSGNDVAAWAAQPWRPVEASDNTYNLPCPPSSHAITGNDTLTLRFASVMPVAAQAGRVQLQTDTRHGTLFANGSPPLSDPTATVFDYHLRAWYIDQESSEPPLPALKRYTLAANGLLQNQEIMPGVEDFQVRLGIDSDGDAIVDRFVAPDSTAGNPVVAVRIGLRLRAAQPERGLINTGGWHNIDTESLEVSAPDNLRRIAVERTVQIRNVAVAP